MRKKDITYVSLDSKTIIADQEFQTMTAEERGVYWTLILYLYANGGSFIFDSQILSRICNCDNFDKVWEKIEHNFRKKGAKLFHKMVSKELSRTAKLLQVRKKAGIKGANARWQTQSQPNAKRSEATRSDGKGREVRTNRTVPQKSKDLLFSKKIIKGLDDFSVGNSSVKSGRVDSSNIEARKLALHDILLHNLKALGSRNGVTFRNFTNWLGREIQAGRFDNTIWNKVATLAEECLSPSVKNPPALFMKKVKSELGYLKDE